MEGFILDGLDLNDGVDFMLEEFVNSPPEPRGEWIEGDQGSIPADPNERWENRRPTARIRVVGGGGGVPSGIIRLAQEEATLGEWDAHNTSGAGTAVARDNSRAYAGSWSRKFTAGATADTNSIARSNWFAPPGAQTETDPLGVIGDERWLSSALFVPSGEDHQLTRLLGMNSHPGLAIVPSIFHLLLDDTVLRLRMSDYSTGGDPTGVPDVEFFSDVPMVFDEWVHLECGFLCAEDPAVGWAELWVDGVQVGSRQTNRTIKLDTQEYLRVQAGMGNYTAVGSVSGAGIWLDETRLASRRQGP